MVNLAIFASGSGTNTQRLIQYFHNHPDIRIALVISNNPEAYVLKRAEDAGIPSFVFSRKDFEAVEPVMDCLKEQNIDIIVLAGFLLLIPAEMIIAFRDRIINIHPALLPAYGGKGMYGMRVHEAVILNRERESGITVHVVNEQYDAGKIIFQKSCDIDDDTPETLAEKIHALEYKYYPQVVENFVMHCFPSS
jgi:phosphoribosylglycinamide formyltransferase 1